MVKYCELIKKEIDKKGFKRQQIIDELFQAKKAWNYPTIKLKESEEKLIHSEIQQMTNILSLLLNVCPNIPNKESVCDSKCKWYYELLSKSGKLSITNQ